MNRNMLEQSDMLNGNPDITESINNILTANRGRYVVCEFLIGTNIILRREGYIISSGVNFVTLYRKEEDLYQVCDLYSLKFMYFSERGIPDLSGVDNNSVCESRNPAFDFNCGDDGNLRQRPGRNNCKPNNFYR